MNDYRKKKGRERRGDGRKPENSERKIAAGSLSMSKRRGFLVRALTGWEMRESAVRRKEWERDGTLRVGDWNNNQGTSWQWKQGIEGAQLRKFWGWRLVKHRQRNGKGGTKEQQHQKEKVFGQTKTLSIDHLSSYLAFEKLKGNSFYLCLVTGFMKILKLSLVRIHCESV